MRREPTDAERKLWAIVRGKRLSKWKFKRQEQIGDYIADFVCFGARLIVEADGSQHAENDDDSKRDTYLTNQGFRVLRFWNNDILTNPDGVAAALLAALETHLTSPSPQTPLPQGGEGLSITARQLSSPLAGEEGARAEGVGRRGGKRSSKWLTNTTSSFSVPDPAAMSPRSGLRSSG